MRSPTVTPQLQRIAAQAARDPDWVFTTLAHLIDEDFLREAYHQTKKASAPGIDGGTAQTYAEHLDENLRDLHERLRSGRYQAAGARVDREGRGGSAPDRQAGVRGQDCPASGDDAVGSDLRARLLRRLVRLSTGSQPSRGTARATPAMHDGGYWLDRGCRCQWILQHIHDDSAVFLSASLIFREADYFVPCVQKTLWVGANRGTTGIDGVVSSGIGFGEGLHKPCTVLIGDQALLHDLNALALLAGASVRLFQAASTA